MSRECNLNYLANLIPKQGTFALLFMLSRFRADRKHNSAKLLKKIAQRQRNCAYGNMRSESAAYPHGLLFHRTDPFCTILVTELLRYLRFFLLSTYRDSAELGWGPSGTAVCQAEGRLGQRWVRLRAVWDSAEPGWACSGQRWVKLRAVWDSAEPGWACSRQRWVKRIAAGRCENINLI